MGIFYLYLKKSSCNLKYDKNGPVNKYGLDCYKQNNSKWIA